MDNLLGGGSSTGMDGGMACLSSKGMAGLSSMGMEEGGRVQGGALQGKTGPDLGKRVGSKPQSSE